MILGLVTYSCEIADTRQSEDAFAVMLLPVPGFPDDGPISDVVRDPPGYAVIGANNATGGWGFCELNPQEKECIGDALLAAGAKPHEWKWCALFSTPALRGGRRYGDGNE